MVILSVSGLTKRFGGFTAVIDVSFEVNEGEILGLIGPNGSGKSTTFNCIAGMYAPTARLHPFRGRGDRRADGQPRLPQGHRPHVPDPAAVPQSDPARERRALGLLRTGRQDATARDCWRQAEEALALVGLPTDPHIATDGLGAAALKKLELARALATQPQLLLADESLNGLDHAEMDQAADMLQRIRKEKGITIVWVEHIMGVLMRVVDRVVVLDHGEKIFDGAPKEAQTDAAWWRSISARTAA